MTYRVSACFLCSATTGDIRVSLVEWREPIGRKRFTDGPRCVDRQVCRDRVEASGMSWEVVDRTTANVVEAPAAPEPEPAEPTLEEMFA